MCSYRQDGHRWTQMDRDGQRWTEMCLFRAFAFRPGVVYIKGVAPTRQRGA
jgi:hypothetical protein